MRAVIFDMDGVIVDSEAHWKLQEAGFFKSCVPGWTDAHHERIVGMGPEDVFEHLAREHGLALGRREFLERCDGVARKVYLEGTDLAPGFIELTLDLRHKGIKTAIASSSPHRWIKLVLDRFKLTALLDAVISADDVGGRTKPRPDIYLEAASRLGCPPGECLAIEDSAIGLLAAKRAGLKTAAFRNGANEGQDLSAADFELGSFAELDFERLASRLRR